MTASVPNNMRAAVYRGESVVTVDEVHTPEIGPGEILIRVEACGVCHTDLKKIEYNLLAPPRIFGHETAGIVAAVGSAVTRYKTGDRVIVFHHIPCGKCFYCERKLYAQCPVYKNVGVTAGFEPAGGGFAQYVRVMDWIVESGVEKIPDGVPFEVAAFVEPVNTCLKAVEQCDPKAHDVVLVQGQGPIGLIFTMLLKLRGCTIVTTDTIPSRLALSKQCGASFALDPRTEDVVAKLRELTGGRGADMVFVATAAKGLAEEAIRSTRPGAKIMLFAQTSDKERIELSGASICVGERSLLGSYSASVELQAESARLVFSGELPVNLLISHRVPLDKIEFAFRLATHPGDFPGRESVENNCETTGAYNLRAINDTMLAAVLYGKEHVQMERVPVPEIGPGDLLVRVRTALTCGTDVKVYRRGYHARMIVPPALFGHELAGDVIAVGERVKGFEIGQRVVAANSAPCHRCFYCSRGRVNLCEDLLFNNGAYAEYIRIPARIVRVNTYVIPPHLDYRDAALAEPLACVVKGVEDVEMKAGDTVAVIGAGPIGSMFVRLAKLRGARVIAVGRTRERLERVARLGADRIVASEDGGNPITRVRELTGGRGADIVIEAVGKPETWNMSVEMLRRGGTVNFFGGPPSGTHVDLDTNLLHYSEITCKASFHHTPTSMQEALDIISSGGVRAHDFVEAEESLENLSRVMFRLAEGGTAFKTAIIP